MTEPVTVEGVIDSIPSRNGGGAIIILSPIGHNPDKEKAIISYDLLPYAPSIGEIWSVTGVYEQHPAYGKQIRATTCNRKRPTGAVLVDFLARNNRFAGVGEITANRLWSIFGEELYKILDDGDRDVLVSRGKMLPKVADDLVTTWQKYGDETVIIEWLHKHRFPRHIASRIYEYYGTEAIARLTEDPYRMLAFAIWSKVDMVAHNLGVQANDARRQAAAIEYALYRHYDKGHTAVPRQTLNQDARRLLGYPVDLDALFPVWERRAVEWVNQGIFQSLGAFALEERIRARVAAILQGEPRQGSLFDPVFNSERLKAFEAANSIRLNVEQTAAIRLVINYPLCCILGGAGVGKTTVLKAIYDQLGPQAVIYQMALTGRAAGRLMETTGRDACTIAAFLHTAWAHEVPSGSFIFIDEASMLDVPTMYRIFKVMPPGCRLCLVGDPHQLPPIGPGLVFHLMAKAASIPRVELIDVHRQAAATGIPAIGAAIRRQQIPTMDEFQGVKHRDFGVSFVETDDPIQQAVKVYRQCRRIGEVQVMAARNATCDQINEKLHEEHLALLDYEGKPMQTISGIAVGEPILHHSRNDYERDLYNGSIGVLSAIYDSPTLELAGNGDIVNYVAEAEFDSSGRVKLTTEDFAFIRLGYCITVHKAQGSQFERAIIVSEPAKMVDNTWFYTAITRAARQVVLLGDRKVFNAAISSPPQALSRTTGLRF